jgi:hypothetical protein
MTVISVSRPTQRELFEECRVSDPLPGAKYVELRVNERRRWVVVNDSAGMLAAVEQATAARSSVERARTMDPETIITPAKFKAATGFDPQHDDLDRCNCVYSGSLGHQCCGWNRRLNKPQFMLGPQAWNGRPMPVTNGER